MSEDNKEKSPILLKQEQPVAHPPKKIELGIPSSKPVAQATFPTATFSEGSEKEATEPRRIADTDPLSLLGLVPSDDSKAMMRALVGQTGQMQLGNVMQSVGIPGPKGYQEPKLENIVSTVNFDCELDLRKIALHAKNAEYNPKRFAAVIMRIRDPKTTALIFRSGKMVCTGAKSESDSETAARKYAKTIKKLGFDVKFKEFTIQNIVGSCSVNFAINLEILQNQHQRFCTYDPEIFPGLIYRMEQPRIVLLIFCSGKVVLTGAKKREQLSQAFSKIYPTLKVCQKKDTVIGPQ